MGCGELRRRQQFRSPRKHSVSLNAVNFGGWKMTAKEEVIRRIGKIDEIRTILDDIRRSEMTELEELEKTGCI